MAAAGTAAATITKQFAATWRTKISRSCSLQRLGQRTSGASSLGRAQLRPCNLQRSGPHTTRRELWPPTVFALSWRAGRGGTRRARSISGSSCKSPQRPPREGSGGGGARRAQQSACPTKGAAYAARSSSASRHLHAQARKLPASLKTLETTARQSTKLAGPSREDTR